MRQLFRGRATRTERGAAAVEFALVMPILFLLVFGIIQYGLFFYSMQSGTSAVGEAVRRVSVGDCTNAAELKTFLKNRLGAATTAAESSLAPVVTYIKADGITTGYEVGGKVSIELTYPALNMGLPFIPLPDSGNVSRTYTARVEDTTSSAGGCS